MQATTETAATLGTARTTHDADEALEAAAGAEATGRETDDEGDGAAAEAGHEGDEATAEAPGGDAAPRAAADATTAADTAAEVPPAEARGAADEAPADETTRPTAVIPLSWDGATWLFGGFEADVEGVFVATHDPLPVGTEADVVLVLPDGAHVAAHGTVVLAKQADHRDAHEADHHGDGWPGYGLRFTDVKGDGLARLARLAERRHPLFYPD